MAGERITEALAAVTTAHRDLMVAAERTCRMGGKDPDYAFAVAPFRLVRTVAALENALEAELPLLLADLQHARVEAQYWYSSDPSTHTAVNQEIADAWESNALQASDGWETQDLPGTPEHAIERGTRTNMRLVVEAARAVVRGLPTGVATPPYLQIAALRAALAVLDSTTEGT